MGITFAVDDVAPAALPLPEDDAEIAVLFGREMTVASHAVLRLAGPSLYMQRRPGAPHDRVHALVLAVHLAFSGHRPLVLTPDAVWLTLAQGFAIHVRTNAEALRQRFVRHRGKKTLEVRVLSLASADEWGAAIRGFAGPMTEDLGPGTVALFTRPFSTTGPVELVAAHVALLDTFQEYFEYELACICGIPEITLEGTPEDWRDLRRRVEVMGEYGLQRWAEALLPVCDELVATAEGRPDRQFWQAIYKPREQYTDALATGWIVRLFPYLQSAEGNFFENELAPAAPEEPEPPAEAPGLQERLAAFKARRRAGAEPSASLRALRPAPSWTHQGVALGSFPRSISSVVVKVTGAAEPILFEVMAGLVGVSQASDGLALKPEAAWAVCPSSRL
jgi:hypothetical protein